MSIFKCKMCGGALEITAGETVSTCEYCGTQQTLPKLDDEKRSQMYDRANHFRRNNEYDKAMSMYEKILNEDANDAEAYWSLVLCRYGIEYVEDPASHRRVPTVNRAQFTSVFEDDNYKSALQHADVYQKAIYEAEAAAINEIQKGILAISQKEEPFDVFICYKETDASGRRTPDSVLANDLYHQLTGEGFKVFFSRITLEDKLGTAYEPYIFAALNSAKVMVVLGTKPEFFNAVWVKNEWSRYLALIRQGQKKMLIPAYKDMDPYDLPEEFSHLQAQDMSKLGFMQDLIHGIKKIAQTDAPKQTIVKETVVTGGNTAVEPLLKRAFMFLEDGDWKSADEYCEKVLDMDPENAGAYLGKLLAEYKVHKKEYLKNCAQSFEASANYKKAVRFGGDALKKDLAGYIEHIKTRNENARLEDIYSRAKTAMLSAFSESGYKGAASTFQSIRHYKDAEALAKECLENAEIARKDAILAEAQAKMENTEQIAKYEEAIRLLKTIAGWREADALAAACYKRIEEIAAKEEAERIERERQAEQERIERERREEQERIEEEIRVKRNRKIAAIAAPIVCAILAFVIVLNTVIIPKINRNSAIEKYGVEFVVEFENLKVGDTYKFGTYEQDNNTANGKEDIEWLVLAKKDRKALIISKFGLDCKPYNTNNVDITWKTCTLRKWLNNSFINTAFSTVEKAMIPTMTVLAHANPEYDTNPGNATEDKVFLLSIPEVNRYFTSDSARACKPTEYAVARGAYANSDNGNCWWWLRSPGDCQYTAVRVLPDGYVDGSGSNVFYDHYAVRPALWIDLNS